MLIISIYYMYDIVADMQYASLQGKSPRTFTARNVLPRRRGSLWRPRMGWRESMKLETKTLLKTSVTSWYVVMFFKGLFFFGIDCWHWFMCWMKKIFQSLPIVDLYGCDTLPRWNGKFPSGRMMRSQCHRKAIPDTRCWLRGLTAGWKVFFAHKFNSLMPRLTSCFKKSRRVNCFFSVGKVRTRPFHDKCISKA